MKNLLFVFFLFAIGASAQTLSPKVIASAGGYFSGGANSLSWTMGETVIPTLQGGSKMLSQGFEQPEVELLNLTAFLEGFYTGSSTMKATLFNLGYSTDSTATDTIQVNLWSPAHLGNSNPDYTSKTILHKNGNATVACNGTVAGVSFYLAIKHRNSIETWSKNPFTFAGTVSYNFSTVLSQAYNSGVNPPMKNMGGGVFAFYSGDVNKDGICNGLDFNQMESDVRAIATGYKTNDVNGDGIVNGADFNLLEGNVRLIISMQRPF